MPCTLIPSCYLVTTGRLACNLCRLAVHVRWTNTGLRRGKDERIGNDNVLSAGDVEDDNLGNVLRCEGLHASISSIGLGLVAAEANDGEFRLGRAGVNLHDANLGVHGLAAQAVGEAADGGLGRAVDGAAGVGLAAGNGANVDYIAGAAVRASKEDGKNGLSDVDEARDVCVEHDVDVGFGNVADRLDAADAAGIVDENVDILVLVRQLAHKGAHLVGLADVELQRQDLDTVADLPGDVGSNLLDGVETAGGEDQTQVMRLREGKLEGAGLADAGGGAGDEDGLAGETLAGGGGDDLRSGRHGASSRCGMEMSREGGGSAAIGGEGERCGPGSGDGGQKDASRGLLDCGGGECRH